MPSEWTKHNIKCVEDRLDSCPHELIPLVHEVLSIAKGLDYPGTEEQAETLLSLQEQIRLHPSSRTGKGMWGPIAEVLAVCLYKDLRKTVAVQEDMAKWGKPLDP